MAEALRRAVQTGQPAAGTGDCAEPAGTAGGRQRAGSQYCDRPS